MCDNSFVNVLLGCLACFLQSKKQKQNTSQMFNIYNWDRYNIYIYIYMCVTVIVMLEIFKESLQGTHWTLRLIRIGSSSSVYTSGSQFQSSRPAYFVCYSYHFRCLFYSNVSALRSGHHRIFRHDSSSKRTYIYSIKSVLKCARWIKMVYGARTGIENLWFTQTTSALMLRKQRKLLWIFGELLGAFLLLSVLEERLCWGRP